MQAGLRLAWGVAMMTATGTGVLASWTPHAFVATLGDTVATAQAADWAGIGLEEDDFAWPEDADLPVKHELRYQRIDDDDLVDAILALIVEDACSFVVFRQVAMDEWRTLGTLKTQHDALEGGFRLLWPEVLHAGGKALLSHLWSTAIRGPLEAFTFRHELLEVEDDGFDPLVTTGDDPYPKPHPFKAWSDGRQVIITCSPWPVRRVEPTALRLTEDGRWEEIATPEWKTVWDLQRSAPTPRSLEHLPRLHPERVAADLRGPHAVVRSRDVWRHLGIDPDVFDFIDQDKEEDDKPPWELEAYVEYTDFLADGTADAFVTIVDGWTINWLVLEQYDAGQWRYVGRLGDRWIENYEYRQNSTEIPSVLVVGGRTFLDVATGTAYPGLGGIVRSIHLLEDGVLTRLWEADWQSLDLRAHGEMVVGEARQDGTNRVRLYALAPGSRTLTPVITLPPTLVPTVVELKEAETPR